MTKKRNYQTWMLWSVIGIVGVLAIGGVAISYQGALRNIILENGAVMNYNEAPSQDTIVNSEPALGSVASPDIESRYLCVNGDCTYHLTGRFIDASTTIVAIPNPFLQATSTDGDVVLEGNGTIQGYTGATSTLELVRLNITGVATSTATIQCGASAGPTTDPTLDIISSDPIATSTYAVIENNIATAANLGVGGGTTAKVMLSPALPWIVCTVSSSFTGAFTEATNTFDGYYTIRVSKTRF